MQEAQGHQVPQVNHLQWKEGTILYERDRRLPLILNQMQVKVSCTLKVTIAYICYVAKFVTARVNSEHLTLFKTWDGKRKVHSWDNEVITYSDTKGCFDKCSKFHFLRYLGFNWRSSSRNIRTSQCKITVKLSEITTVNEKNKTEEVIRIKEKYQCVLYCDTKIKLQKTKVAFSYGSMFQFVSLHSAQW